MGTRVKTFVATGLAPNGRVYAGDLNAIQDQYADLSNFNQVVDLATLRIGTADIQLLKYAAGDTRLTSALRVDSILRALGGLISGAFTTTERNALVDPPYGLVILNTTTNTYEWQSSAPGTPAWIPLGVALGTVTSLIYGNVTAVYSAGTRTNGQTYTITAPAAGTYIVEWGAGGSFGDSQGDSSTITNNKTTGTSRYSDVAQSGGPVVVPGIVCSAGEVITFTVAASVGAGVHDYWAKLTRTA